MAKRATSSVREKSSPADNGKKVTSKDEARRSLAIALGGIEDSRSYAQFMSALITDLIVGSVSAQVGNATCNAAGKLLKVVELQHKYGGTTGKPFNFPLIAG